MHELKGEQTWFELAGRSSYREKDTTFFEMSLFTSPLLLPLLIGSAA